MENTQKQVIFSVLGIAVLVVAVIGVSFAFFTYSKTGTKNNTITTGRINFEYTGTNNMNLTNQFPKTATEATASEDPNSHFDFTITGNIPTSAKTVNYSIYAVEGEEKAGKERIDDSNIRLYLKKTSTQGATPEGTFGDASQGGLATGLTGGQVLLGKSSIAAGANETHQYSLYMWVDEGVTISDTNGSATYCASPQGEDGSGCSTGKKVYSNLYYSLKVKVEANDTVE